MKKKEPALALGIDCKMYPDKNNILKLGTKKIYEPHVLELFKHYVKENNTIFDIGAHVGYYTLLASKLVGPDGMVHSFEPSKSNFELLQENIALNNVKNVVLNNKAAKDVTEEGKLYMCAGNTGDNRAFESKNSKRPTMPVGYIKIDDYVKEKNIQKVDFIKMDIQGSEYFAINGMKNLLTENKDIMFMTEYWPIGLREAGIEPKQFLDLCFSLGFKYTVVNKDFKTIKGRVDEKPLLKLKNHINLFWKR